MFGPNISKNLFLKRRGFIPKTGAECRIDVKVLPKSMTHGYESWWRCGIAAVADKPEINKAADKMNAMVKKIRQY